MHLRAAPWLGLSAALLLAGQSLAASDQKFIRDAINTNNAEIALGKLALTRAQAPNVRSYASMLVTDHTKGNVQAVAAAKELGVKPPVGMTSDTKAEYNKLKALTGPQFDQEYVSAMVQGHQKAIAEFENEAKTGGKITAPLAKKTLPTLQQHLTMGQSLMTKS